jgi:predicted NBD/HSP70 family sugar kinase
MPDLRDLLREPRSARDESRLRILRAVLAGSANQADLVRRSGMSGATVSAVVNELEREGVIRSTRRGRDVIVTMTPTAGVAVGVELGFQHTVVVARHAHQPFAEAQVRTTTVGADHGVQRWLDAVVRLVLDIAAEVGDGPQELACVGLAVPRAVNPRTQLFTPPLLPPWEDVADPAGLIIERLHKLARADDQELPQQLRVMVDNDAALGALAESTYALPRAETLIYVKASTGIGAGIVIGGRVFRGGRGVAGEIGHTTVDREGQFCLCGGRGCLETVAGSDSLVKQAAVLDRPPKNIEELVERARLGNAVCRRVLREAASRLGRTIGDLCNVLNPEVVVLGGALGRVQDDNLVLAPCRAGIAETAVSAAHEEGFDLVRSSVEHASAHGALLAGLAGTTYSNKSK